MKNKYEIEVETVIDFPKDKKTGKKKRQSKWFFDALVNSKTAEERSRVRSKTFPGIAKAMAEQWTENLND